jgi:hypothetical protein
MDELNESMAAASQGTVVYPPKTPSGNCLTRS